MVPCVQRRKIVEMSRLTLGFGMSPESRSGIHQKRPTFISYLIEDEGLSYAQVMRRIGSKTPTVRQHYIAYRLLSANGERRSQDISIEASRRTIQRDVLVSAFVRNAAAFSV